MAKKLTVSPKDADELLKRPHWTLEAQTWEAEQCGFNDHLQEQFDLAFPPAGGGSADAKAAHERLFLCVDLKDAGSLYSRVAHYCEGQSWADAFRAFETRITAAPEAERGARITEIVAEYRQNSTAEVGRLLAALHKAKG